MIPLLCIVLFAAKCREALYSTLDEKQATEMLAILLRAGIPSDKHPAKDGVWVVRTDAARFSDAVAILSDAGYPKARTESMGTIFEKKSFISSPLEERVRYMYALSQELSATIGVIDGVIAARVHIALPNNDPLQDSLIPSSASVFVKYHPSASIQDRIPQIRQLVLNSIEGLTADKISIVSVAAAPAAAVVSLREVAGIRVHPDSSKGVIAILLLTIATALASFAVLIWSLRSWLAVAIGRLVRVFGFGKRAQSRTNKPEAA